MLSITFLILLLFREDLLRIFVVDEAGRHSSYFFFAVNSLELLLSDDDAFSVFSGLDSVDSDNPVLTSEGFFESSQLESFMLKVNQPYNLYSDLSTSEGVITVSSVVRRLDFIESVVAELVHKAVQHGFRGVLIDSVLRN